MIIANDAISFRILSLPIVLYRDGRTRFLFVFVFDFPFFFYSRIKRNSESTRSLWSCALRSLFFSRLLFLHEPMPVFYESRFDFRLPSRKISFARCARKSRENTRQVLEFDEFRKFFKNTVVYIEDEDRVTKKPWSFFFFFFCSNAACQLRLTQWLLFFLFYCTGHRETVFIRCDINFWYWLISLLK